MRWGERRSRGGRAVVVAGLAAQVSIATVGALPWLVLPISAAAYVAAAESSDRATGRRSEVLRWAGTVLALVGLVLLAPMVIGTGDRAEIKRALGLMLVIAQIGQAMGWRQARDVRSALMASFGLLVLSASYAPDVLVGVPLVLGWVAIAVALALLGGLGRLEATRTAAAAVALGLVGFLLIPVTPTQGARNRLAALAAGHNGRPLEDSFGTTQLDLRQRDTLSPTGVLRVPKDAPPLWRAISFDTYDGTGWTRHPLPRALPGGGPTYQLAVSSRPTRTDLAQRVDPAELTVWSPGPIVRLAGQGVFASPLVDDLGEADMDTSSYTVTSEQPVTDLSSLRSTRGLDQTDPRWRQLPATLPNRVRLLARELSAATRYDTAQTIATYLRANETYQLDSPVPLPGEDAVDRFLFVDHAGFCEQFASAEVVLLRALGIPSRLVTGLAYGVQDHGSTLFRVSDRHAWVELWVPGAGWVSSDPTAGSRLTAGAGASVRQRLATALSTALRALTRLPGGRPALAAALLAIAVLASALLTRRRPPEATWRPRGPVGPALAAFLRLDATLGERRRRQEESLRELGRRLDPGLAQALVVVERECYAAARPEAAEVRAAVAVLDRASAPDRAAPRARRGRRAAPGRRPPRG